MEITEDNVIRQYQLKNPAALEYLILTYGKAVHALVVRVMGNVGTRQDAEECVSDVFVQAWEKHHLYQPKLGSLKTWLLILAKYKVLDMRRKLVKESLTEEFDHNLPSFSSHIEEAVLAKESLHEIYKIILEFAELDQRIFIKRYIWYESIENIAGELELSRAAVDNRLWRCRKRLQERLQMLRKEDLL